MFTFESKITHDSAAFPGVKFTIRRLNQIQRAKRDLEIATKASRLTELSEKWRASTKDTKAEESITPEQSRLLGDIQNEHAATAMPIIIRHGFLSMEGFEINGDSPTVEQIIESGPEQLVQEIFDACVAAAGLSEEQQKNSQSPGDSPRQTGGATELTTVATVAA
jgi:hypothetical protein